MLLPLITCAESFALNWSKTRNRTTLKAFQIPDFSLTLRKNPSSMNLQSSFVQFMSMQNSAGKIICLVLGLTTLHGFPTRLVSRLVTGSLQLLANKAA